MICMTREDVIEELVNDFRNKIYDDFIDGDNEYLSVVLETEGFKPFSKYTNKELAECYNEFVAPNEDDYVSIVDNKINDKCIVIGTDVKPGDVIYIKFDDEGVVYDRFDGTLENHLESYGYDFYNDINSLSK